MNVVIDSNLLVVLVNRDPRSEMTRRQFDEWIDRGIQIHAPILALYEVANSLTRLIVAGIFPEEELAAAWTFLDNLLNGGFAYIFWRVPSSGLWKKARRHPPRCANAPDNVCWGRCCIRNVA